MTYFHLDDGNLLLGRYHGGGARLPWAAPEAFDEHHGQRSTNCRHRRRRRLQDAAQQKVTERTQFPLPAGALKPY